MQILINDFTEYIESSGRGIDAEHKRLTGTQQKHKADEVKPNIAHTHTSAHDAVTYLLQHFTGTAQEIRMTVCIHDRLTCLELRQDIGVIDHLVSKIRTRIDTIPHLRQRTQDHRRIDRFGAKLIPDKQESQQQQKGVDSHYPIRERICVAAH